MFRRFNQQRGLLDSAFEELVRRHEESIYRVAYRLTGNHEDAEDLVQDALVEGFEAFHRFKTGTFFDRWMYRIIRNTFTDHARSKRRVEVRSLDSWSDATDSFSAADQLPDNADGPDAILLSQVLDEQVERALQGLRDEHRLVIVLADIEELNYEEISKILGCPIGTVRSRLHRAREALRGRLADYPRQSARSAS